MRLRNPERDRNLERDRKPERDRNLQRDRNLERSCTNAFSYFIRTDLDLTTNISEAHREKHCVNNTYW